MFPHSINDLKSAGTGSEGHPREVKIRGAPRVQDFARRQRGEVKKHDAFLIGESQD
jgi:hypothetical protein